MIALLIIMSRCNNQIQSQIENAMHILAQRACGVRITSTILQLLSTYLDTLTNYHYLYVCTFNTLLI